MNEHSTIDKPPIAPLELGPPKPFGRNGSCDHTPQPPVGGRNQNKHRHPTMKNLHRILATLCAAGFLFAAGASLAESCCVKAKSAGKDCDHKCCVEARKNKKSCEKCQADASCCDKAISQGKECDHKCCKEAAKAKKACEACNKKKEKAPAK